MTQLHPEQQDGRSERQDPPGELELVTGRMRRTLEQTFSELGWPTRFGLGAWAPPVDIEESDEALVVEAELPGIRPDEVNVELVGNELTISGEIEERERTGRLRRQTRRTGRFDYRLGLPGEVDADAVEARLANGVLTVRVPRSERVQRRAVNVTS